MAVLFQQLVVFPTTLFMSARECFGEFVYNTFLTSTLSLQQGELLGYKRLFLEEV